MPKTHEELTLSRHLVARLQRIEGTIQEADRMLTVLGRDFVPRVADDLRGMMTELVKEAQTNLAIARRTIAGDD